VRAATAQTASARVTGSSLDSNARHDFAQRQRLADPDDRARFLREGRLAASINHPHSVYIFGSEEIAGTPVIAMELSPRVPARAAAGTGALRYRPYEVVGTPGSTDVGELLVGFDPSLRRHVWIHWVGQRLQTAGLINRAVGRPNAHVGHLTEGT
jgi:hypothetical protein